MVPGSKLLLSLLCEIQLCSWKETGPVLFLQLGGLVLTSLVEVSGSKGRHSRLLPLEVPCVSMSVC